MVKLLKLCFGFIIQQCFQLLRTDSISMKSQKLKQFEILKANIKNIKFSVRKNVINTIRCLRKRFKHFKMCPSLMIDSPVDRIQQRAKIWTRFKMKLKKKPTHNSIQYYWNKITENEISMLNNLKGQDTTAISRKPISRYQKKNTHTKTKRKKRIEKCITFLGNWIPSKLVAHKNQPQTAYRREVIQMWTCDHLEVKITFEWLHICKRYHHNSNS